MFKLKKGMRILFDGEQYYRLRTGSGKQAQFERL